MARTTGRDLAVFWSSKHRGAALAIASVAWLLGAAPAAAATPTIDTWTVHLEVPFVDCPDFTTVGIWDVNHKLTVFYDEAGVAVRDIEAIDFNGRIVNPESGAWVPDSGVRTFFDTLAPDGSFLTTYMVQVRKSAYIHMAGRTDFQTGDFTGTFGLDDAGVASLCAALGG
jgi:hypothetical protein